MAHVLIVEDEPTLAQLAATILARAGHTTVVARDGQEAIAALSRGTFDVCLLDYMLARGMDGIALARHIQTIPAWADLPLVAVTARVMPAEIAALLGAGITHIVSKPYRAEELRQTIMSAGKRNHP